MTSHENKEYKLHSTQFNYHYVAGSTHDTALIQARSEKRVCFKMHLCYIMKTYLLTFSCISIRSLHALRFSQIVCGEGNLLPFFSFGFRSIRRIRKLNPNQNWNRNQTSTVYEFEMF